MRYITPLRYPGGKARLAPFLAEVVTAQTKEVDLYVEPFAGGAGAALRLLFDGVVQSAIINDVNPGIVAFWRSVQSCPRQLCEAIARTPVTIGEWHRQRHIYNVPGEHDDLELGFATFFLNRTNRSGILDAGPIGGLKQEGAWTLDARYNKDALIARVETVAAMKDRLIVREEDAVDLLSELRDSGRGTLVYADPPYVKQGNRLYLHGFTRGLHRGLATELRRGTYLWLATYDDHPFVLEDLYKEERCARFGISHTAQNSHVGTETMIFGDNLLVPDDREITPGAKANSRGRGKHPDVLNGLA